MPSFMMMMGVPGSGKSTYVKTLKENGATGEVVSRDSIVMTLGQLYTPGASYTECFQKVDHREVDRMLNARLENLLGEKQNIILDMTNLIPQSRLRHLSKVGSDYEKWVIVHQISKATMLERNELRKVEGKYIPTQVLDSMYESFSMPTLAEGWDHIIVMGEKGE